MTRGNGSADNNNDADDFETREDVYKGKQSHYEQQHVNDGSHFPYVHCQEDVLGFTSQTIEGSHWQCKELLSELSIMHWVAYR